MVSYFTARPSSNVILAARQQMTKEWWGDRINEFEIFISELVKEEANAAAAKRTDAIRSFTVLATEDVVTKMANSLVQKGPIPEKAQADAMHLALAAVHKMDYLLTWNCRHLASASMRNAINDVLRVNGLVEPVICTPMDIYWRTGNERPNC